MSKYDEHIDKMEQKLGRAIQVNSLKIALEISKCLEVLERAKVHELKSHVISFSKVFASQNPHE